VYALYDNNAAWNARTAYVGLTRHKSDVELYVSLDLAENEIDLAKKMARRFREEASLAWATREEVQEKARGGNEKAVPQDNRADKKRDEAKAKESRFPREEADALRRMDMTAYARDVHGYNVQPDPSGEPNRFVIARANAGGKIEKLEVRRAADGHWTFRDPANRYRRGDIFDLAMKEGAPNLQAAREKVAEYFRHRPDAEHEKDVTEERQKTKDSEREKEKDRKEKEASEAEERKQKKETNEKKLSFFEDNERENDLDNDFEP
jgi:hypothetical protein